MDLSLISSLQVVDMDDADKKCRVPSNKKVLIINVHAHMYVYSDVFLQLRKIYTYDFLSQVSPSMVISLCYHPLQVEDMPAMHDAKV